MMATTFSTLSSRSQFWRDVERAHYGCIQLSWSNKLAMASIFSTSSSLLYSTALQRFNLTRDFRQAQEGRKCRRKHNSAMSGYILRWQRVKEFVHIDDLGLFGSKRSSWVQAADTRWQCQASWFDFSSESSSKSGGKVTTGDFTILSHLKELGCGDLVRRPRELHFSGCINESYAFHCTGGDYFVKINRAFDMDSMFAGESEALRRLEATETIVVPSPLGCGNLPDGGSYIIMKHLRFRPFGMMQESSQAALGRDLARLHQADAGTLFGFPLETRVGVVPLDNCWSSTWSEFFIEQRLRDRLQRAYDKLGDQSKELEEKGARILEKSKELLEHHEPKTSVLHGDLWMGNTGLVSTGEVAIFDPASFVGDAEFDLAFEGWTPVEHFPGFSSAFYTAYHGLLPQAPGFEKRHQLYQLFHLLNHFVIYGGEYYTHVTAMVDHVIA